MSVVNSGIIIGVLREARSVHDVRHDGCKFKRETLQLYCCMGTVCIVQSNSSQIEGSIFLEMSMRVTAVAQAGVLLCPHQQVSTSKNRLARW